MIGDMYRLKTGVLGMPIGSIGYVFEEYPDFDNKNEKGIQIILENGNYDGFSVEEQDLFLEYVGFDKRFSTYLFKNVIQVQSDYRKGYWEWKR